jgi:hypothetical protein
MVTFITTGFHNLVTYNSKVKLLKYQYMLARQQINKLEGYIEEGNIHEIKGNKIDQLR